MNKITSSNKIEKQQLISGIKSFQESAGFVIPEDFKIFLAENNVGVPSYKSYNRNGIDFTIQYFLGFSGDRYQDLNYYHETFMGRIPDELFVIAAVDDGNNLLLMEKSGNAIYFWDHELNDWGLEGNELWPMKVGENLKSFIEELGNDNLPSDAEIALAKKDGKVTFVSPIGLQLLNKEREKSGLPPLSMKEVLKGQL